jgi:hypothetical protein
MHRIRIIFGSWIRICIRIRVKRWIWTQIRIKVTIQKLERLNVEPWRAVDTHTGGLEAQEWSPGGSVDQWSQILITLKRRWIRKDPDADSH